MIIVDCVRIVCVLLTVAFHFVSHLTCGCCVLGFTKTFHTHLTLIVRNFSWGKLRWQQRMFASSSCKEPCKTSTVQSFSTKFYRKWTNNNGIAEWEQSPHERVNFFVNDRSKEATDKAWRHRTVSNNNGAAAAIVIIVFFNDWNEQTSKIGSTSWIIIISFGHSNDGIRRSNAHTPAATTTPEQQHQWKWKRETADNKQH